MNLEENWPSGFRGEVIQSCEWTTDGEVSYAKQEAHVPQFVQLSKSTIAYLQMQHSSVATATRTEI